MPTTRNVGRLIRPATLPPGRVTPRAAPAGRSHRSGNPLANLGATFTDRLGQFSQNVPYLLLASEVLRALMAIACAGSLAVQPATARAQTTRARTAHAQTAPPPDSSGFLIRLGADTLALERVVTYADSITGDFVTRAPHTSRFTYTAHLTPAPGRLVTAYVMTHYTTGLTSSPEDVRLTADFAADSAHVIVQRKDSSHATSYAAPRTTVPLLEPGFGLHQILISRALAAHGQRIPFAWV